MVGLNPASGAAGLLSVAIIVRQSLLEYYHSWKDAEDSVAQTYVSIEESTKIIKLLNTAIQSKAFSGEIVRQYSVRCKDSSES